MSDPAVETCTVCSAGPVEKLLFPVAVHFKGSGFYSTDYGKGRKKAARDGGDAAGAGTADKVEKTSSEKGSGDTKPAGDSGQGS